MMYQYIKTYKEEHVFHLVLSRAEKRNAFTPTTVNEIAHALEIANDDDDIKVVLLQAEGPVFCAGMDLKTFQNDELDKRNPQIANKNISLGQVFDDLLKPAIAIVEGNVIAGGFLMILGCTYVFAKREVQFRLPELSLGIFPFQVMASLLKVLPEKKVLQLCLETDYFSAEKARNLGIVDGYLDEVDVEGLINSFSSTKAHVLKAGIASLRKLPGMSREEQFTYLKKVLDGLKS